MPFEIADQTVCSKFSNEKHIGRPLGSSQTGEVAFNSAEKLRLKEEASLLEETLFDAGQDDDESLLNDTKSILLQNAVR